MLPGGSVPERFFPSGTGESLGSLSPILAPLERHRDDLLVIEGLDNRAIDDGPIGGHIGGMGSILTGRPVLPSGFVETYESGTSQSYGFASGPSFDQVIAGRFAEVTPFPSVEAGVYVDRFGGNKGQTQWRMSYRAADEPVHPENDPAALFDRLFAGHSDTTDVRAERARRRGAVLTYLRGELARLQDRVPAADREKLERHVDGVAELERNLAASSVSCDVPGLASPEGDTRQRQLRQHMDVLVHAMACDLTRVGSIQIAGEGRTWGPCSWLGHDQEDHVYQHDWNRDRLVEVRRWFAGELAYLVDRLKEIPEGDGTLFDNTVVVWTSGIATGNDHGSRNLPFALLGSAGGYFRTGRVVRTGGMAHNHLLTSLCQAMGLDDVDHFGDASYGRGPVPGLAA
jgi:hypothetical protein